MGLFYKPMNVESSLESESLNSELTIGEATRNWSLSLLGGILLMTLIGLLFSTRYLVRGTVAERLAQTLVEKIETAPLAKNIIVIDGGSYTHRAVDNLLLENSLGQSGSDTTVIQTSLPGANHYERILVLKPVMDALERVPDIESHNVIFLREAHGGYDSYPLSQVRSVNDRLISYANPLSSFRQIQSMLTRSDDPLEDGHKDAIKTLVKATAVNTLGLGRLRDPKRAEQLTDYKGYRPITKNRKTVPKDQFKRAVTFTSYHFYGPKAATGMPSSTARQKWAWTRTNVNPNIEAQKKRLFAQELAFLPITTNLRDLRYFNSYCRMKSSNCLFVDPEYQALLASFNDDTHWVDPNHVSKKGAEAYSGWLVNKLIAAQVLTK